MCNDEVSRLCIKTESVKKSKTDLNPEKDGYEGKDLFKLTEGTIVN
jgi:hypothetical protein